jgi:hypothetical protein
MIFETFQDPFDYVLFGFQYGMSSNIHVPNANIRCKKECYEY